MSESTFMGLILTLLGIVATLSITRGWDETKQGGRIRRAIAVIGEKPTRSLYGAFGVVMLVVGLLTLTGIYIPNGLR